MGLSVSPETRAVVPGLDAGRVGSGNLIIFIHGFRKRQNFARIKKLL